MSHTIVLHGESVSYSIREHARAKRLRLTVYADGDVVVTAPRGTRQRTIQRFVKQQADWLLHQLQNELLLNEGERLGCTGSAAEYKRDKELARARITAALERWNAYYGFRYSRVTVRNQKTRWGSCSDKKTLSFNYRLLYLPDELLDYVIVHELCHLKEMNHSERFWALVEQTIPDYRARRALLKQIAIPYRR